MIDLRRITRTFPAQEQKSPPLPVLSDITLRIPPGQYAAMVGASGSGKSTLMNILGCLDRPTSGVYRLHGRDVSTLPPDELAKVRGEEIGFVFQGFQLIPRLTAIENVMLPLMLQGVSESERRARAEQLLLRVGLHSRMHHLPAALSGGQQQRVAIARALATNPKVLLCDEATSALDPKTTRQILELIGDINKKLGITVVIITHQMSVVKSVCNHVAILDDGEVVEDGLVSTVFSAPKSAAARHLVFPGGADVTVSDPTQERRIRLIFRSAKTTSIPLVARLATEENIAANVISASTQKLSEEIYGSMLLGVPAAQFDRAWEFLSGIENLQVEEASVGVQ